MAKQSPADIARKRGEQVKQSGSTVLDLRALSLRELPVEICHLTSLTHLYLHGNHLTELPAEIGKLTALTQLDLANNVLTELSAEIGKLTALTELNLGDNQLTELPVEIGKLTALTELNLRSNQLTELPAEIGQLMELRKLYLHGNRFTELPVEICHLTSLKELVLAINQLTELPAGIGQLMELRHLHLHGNHLTELPAEIGKLTALTQLDLAHNALTELSAEIGKLTELTQLHIDHTELTELPAEIGKLTELRQLFLRGNQLTKLPAEIGKLTALKHLYLEYNQLTELPVEIGKLTALTELYLCGNQLTKLPAEIGKLTALKHLYLADNRLTELPVEIGKLRNLQELGLDQNELTALPEALRDLDRLGILRLHGNESLNLPSDLLGPRSDEDPGRLEQAGLSAAKALLDYYFRTRGGARPLNEIKLILVGQGEVGKTALVNRLRYGTFTDEGKTEGIKITQLPLTCGADIVRANVWDFGGQDIMHGTHQFFLTERSLYLLVLNGRGGGEDANVEHWLKLIGSFGGDSPVIVVLNKIDEHRFDLNRTALREKYGAGIREFVATDCKTGTGIEELLKVVTRETDRLEHVRTPFPASWTAIKERMAAPGEDYIPFEGFRKICRDLGEVDEVAQSFLAGHLHNLGIALNYKDDPRLRDTSVMNPRWVTTGIYKLLNAQALSDRGGVLAVDDLPQFLPKTGYPRDKHPFLIELMRKFELCFPLDTSGQCYLVPELLGKQEPAGLSERFAPKTCLNFEYHYSPILPEGLLPRFIVRAYAHGTPDAHWRTGTVLEFEGNAALVKADVQDRRVVVRVSGPVEGRRRLLTVIRAHFEHIHRDFKKLEPAAKVPVPQHPTVLVDYNELIDYEAAGDDEIKVMIDRKPTKLSVRELLEGVNLTGPLEKMHPVYGVNYIDRGLDLFYSYSHKDERLRDELQAHLTIMQREGLIRQWHDRRITAGEAWDDRISTELERADIILLLVSSDFIASDYCQTKEVMRAMERHEEREARVIPVIVRECDWKTAPFAKLQGAPKNARHVGGARTRRDKAWTEVATRLRETIKEMQSTR